MDAADLSALYRAWDEELRKRWHRSLSFEDGLFDRWERAKRLGFGDGASIYNSAMVLEPVSVGARSWIGPWVVLDGSGGGVAIGAGVTIAAGVHVYTHDSVMACLSGGVLPRREGKVSIGDCSYIGPQVIVVAGVSVGDRCVVGANSFVNVDVPDRTVVAGTPATVRGRVEGEGATVRIIEGC